MLVLYKLCPMSNKPVVTYFGIYDESISRRGRGDSLYYQLYIITIYAFTHLVFHIYVCVCIDFIVKNSDAVVV